MEGEKVDSLSFGNQDLPNRVFQKNETLIFKEQQSAVGSDSFIHVILGVPLRRSGIPFGVLMLSRDQLTESFTDEEIQFVESLAIQASVAIVNKQLLEETKKLAERERVINEITDSIRRNLDTQTILG